MRFAICNLWHPYELVTLKDIGGKMSSPSFQGILVELSKYFRGESCANGYAWSPPSRFQDTATDDILPQT
jgi:hypothetical protein